MLDYRETPPAPHPMNGAWAASKHEPRALGLGEEGASGGVRMWWGALTHLQTLGGGL